MSEYKPGETYHYDGIQYVEIIEDKGDEVDVKWLGDPPVEEPIEKSNLDEFSSKIDQEWVEHPAEKLLESYRDHFPGDNYYDILNDDDYTIDYALSYLYAARFLEARDGEIINTRSHVSSDRKIQFDEELEEGRYYYYRRILEDGIFKYKAMKLVEKDDENLTIRDVETQEEKEITKEELEQYDHDVSVSSALDENSVFYDKERDVYHKIENIDIKNQEISSYNIDNEQKEVLEYEDDVVKHQSGIEDDWVNDTVERFLDYCETSLKHDEQEWTFGVGNEDNKWYALVQIQGW